MSETFHPISPAGLGVVTELRVAMAATKGVIERASLDQAMELIRDPPGVTYEAGASAGIDGVWSRPESARADAVILYVHGGAYIAGSAYAYRHQAGQIAARTAVPVFTPGYRLAPEHPFPAAVDDVKAVYRALSERCSIIAIAGDSAGGGLALALFADAQTQADAGSGTAPRACAVMSPWTDLTLSGATMQSRADADIMLTESALRTAAAQYLHGADARDPRASPLFGEVAGLPPIHISAGDAELLLDDARRYAQRAADAGVDVTLHVWEGMPHVFESNAGKLAAADEALDLLAAFLNAHLQKA